MGVVRPCLRSVGHFREWRVLTLSDKLDIGQLPRRFLLIRHEDASGVSGVGVVADGIEFTDGQCILSWRGRYHTSEILPNLKAVTDIHGHGGKTEVKWVD